jgi:hypothetical protein
MRTSHRVVYTWLALAALTVAAVTVRAQGTVTITPSSLGGFRQVHDSCGGDSTASQVFVGGTGPLGTGSLQFNLGANGDSFEALRRTFLPAVPLGNLTALSYHTFDRRSSSGQSVYLILTVDLNGDGSYDPQVDDLLFFEPEYQHGYTPDVPDQGDNTVGAWHLWNARAGGWWSLRGLCGAGPGADVKKLDFYLACQSPNVAPAILGLRLAAGCGAGAWDNFIGDADALTIGVNGVNTVYNFDADPPPAGPGVEYPAISEASGQKAGSVLVYNLYSSIAASPNVENTRISVTNTHPNNAITVHLFFIDGASCTPADAFICLTPNQTSSFLASDLDPGIAGYIVAVASDNVTGCPVNFNFLIGDECIKLASGHAANLGAEAIAAVAPAPAVCTDTSSSAVLNFDGASYNQIPQVLAASNLPSLADGNSTLMVINNLAGDLQTGVAVIGPVFGILYDDGEVPSSFTFSANRCQFKALLSPVFPRILGGGLSAAIPSGHSGWMKFWAQASTRGLFGAVINFNPNVEAGPHFNGGHNLHHLTLTPTSSFTIPVFPPAC